METAALTDDALIGRVAARDVDAYGELHRRYVRAVLGLALRSLADREDAEAATPEVFGLVWRDAPRFAGSEADAVRWLYDLARAALGEAVATESPRRWATWRVHRALMSLDEPERSVVELAYWGGMRADEIAAFLHVSRSAVVELARAALGRVGDDLAGAPA